jgi:hypothetical protein
VTSDEQKLAYAYSYLRRQFVGPRLTGGALTTNGVYFLQSHVSGDNFTNVGAAENQAGAVFAATGSAPAAWTRGSILRLVDLAGLKALAATTFAAATDTVTVTSSQFEGGQAGGQITFEKVILGQAIEKLLAEFDPDYDSPAAAGCGFIQQFSPW